MNNEETAIWQEYKKEVQAALEKLYKAQMSLYIKRGIEAKKARLLKEQREE